MEMSPVKQKIPGWTDTGSDNGLVPTRRQAIIWTNDGPELVILTTSATASDENLWKLYFRVSDHTSWVKMDKYGYSCIEECLF